MIHKGLKNEVAEGRLTSQCRAGIAHPHQRRRYGERHDRLFDLAEFGIEFYEGNQYRHNGADVEGQLVDADARIAVRQRHDEKVRDVKSDRQISKQTDQLRFCLFGLVFVEQRQKDRSAQNDEQIQKMPNVKKTDCHLGIVLAEHRPDKFTHDQHLD